MLIVSLYRQSSNLESREGWQRYPAAAMASVRREEYSEQPGPGARLVCKAGARPKLYSDKLYDSNDYPALFFYNLHLRGRCSLIEVSFHGTYRNVWHHGGSSFPELM
jgi:hypothetical protein